MSLVIHLFGDFHVKTGADDIIRFPTRKSKSLLAYVALKRERRALRTALAGELWPESPEDKAQRALNTEVWRLRTALREGGADPDELLDADHQSIGLNARAQIWVDVAAFEQAVGDPSRIAATLAPEPAVVQALARGVALYDGDLMEGVYDEWCLVHREAYRARLIAALELLVRISMDEQGWDRAIAFGQRLLEIDPLLEHVHRALMRCHYVRGNRPAALKQYQACVLALRRDLGVEPMEETKRAFGALMAPPVRPIEEPPSWRDWPVKPLDLLAERRTPADKIEQALSNLSTARDWLEDAGRDLRGQDPPG